MSPDGKLGIGGGGGFPVEKSLVSAAVLLGIFVVTLLGRRELERAGRLRVALLAASIAGYAALALVLTPSSLVFAALIIGHAVMWRMELEQVLRPAFTGPPAADHAPAPRSLAAPFRSGLATVFAVAAVGYAVLDVPLRSVVQPMGTIPLALLAGALALVNLLLVGAMDSLGRRARVALDGLNAGALAWLAWSSGGSIVPYLLFFVLVVVDRGHGAAAEDQEADGLAGRA